MKKTDRYFFLCGLGVCFVLGTVLGYFLASDSSKPLTDQSPLLLSASGSKTARLTQSSSQSEPFRTSSEAMYRQVLALKQGADFEHMMDELRFTSSRTHRQSLLNLTVQRWAEKNASEALGYVSELRPSTGRNELLSVIFGQVARSDPDQALQWVEAFATTDNRSTLMAAAYSGWAEVRPAQAMAATEALPDGPERSWVMREVVQIWAEQDVSAVFDWIETQTADRELQSLYGMVMTQYTSQYPEKAGILIQEMLPGDIKNGLVSQYSLHLVEQGDLSAAFKWADTLNDEQAKAQALTVAFEAWSRQDPGAAFEYAISFNGDSRVGLLEQVAVHMSREDPAAAATNIERFPQEARQVATEQVAMAWAEQNPEAMIQWINSLPESSPTYSHAVKAAIYPLSKRMPETAFELATRLSDSSRSTHIRHAAQAWYEVNPDSALDAVTRDTMLTQNEKNIIVSQVTKHGRLMDLVLPSKE
ncbi:MAG: hypothetical protein AAF571_12760 [Verrucomicrobiota bacterium]